MQKIDPKVPPGLYSLQKCFGSIITTPITSWDEKGIPTIDEKKHRTSAGKLITPNQSLRSVQRIGIYKMQYWLRLFELLKEDFPFVLRLFGDALFEDKIATPYLRKYPSKSWELHLLGVMLPSWIEANYHDGNDKKLVYYASLIDAAYTQLFYTSKYDPISKVDATSKIYLQPFVKLFKLEANLFSFREKFLKKDANYWLDNPFSKLTKGKEFYFVLYLSYNKVKYLEISYSEYFILKSFESGSSIEKTFQNFPSRLVKDANIELWFKAWSENNWLTKKIPKALLP